MEDNERERNHNERRREEGEEREIRPGKWPESQAINKARLLGGHAGDARKRNKSISRRRMSTQLR
jgi:hypothetical protein